MSLAALTAVGTFFLGYAVGSIVEHRRSQWEIDVLTRVIEGCCKEDKSDGGSATTGQTKEEEE